MPRKSVVGALLGLITLAGLSGGNLAVSAQPAKDVVQDADVLRKNLAMTPGPMHQLLARLEGDWFFETTTFTVPGGAPERAQGEAQKRLIFGGRFLEESWRGEKLGAPWQGRSLLGWDNLAKEFQGVFLDDLTTAMIAARGRLEADGAAVTFAAETKNPFTDQLEQLRLVLRLTDENHHLIEIWAKAPKQPERRLQETRYSRKARG